MTQLKALGFLLLPALFILNLGAETVTNSPVADTTLFEPNPTHNLGGHFDVSAGTTLGGPRARGIMNVTCRKILTIRSLIALSQGDRHTPTGWRRWRGYSA